MTCTYKFRYAPLELFLLFLQGCGIFCITTNTRAPKKKIQARCYHNNSQRIILLAIFFLKPWSKIQMPSFNIFVFLVFSQKSDKTVKFSATLASQFFQKNVPRVALFRWACSSFIRTMSPTARFRCSLFHFVRTWRFWIYSRLHLVQNWPARNCNFLHLCRA